MRNSLDLSAKNYNRNLILLLIIISSLLLFSTYLDIKNRKATIDKNIITLEKSINDEYKKRLEESVLNTIKHIETMYHFYLLTQKNDTDELTVKNYKLFEESIREYLYSTIYEKVRYTWINKIKNYKGGDNYAIRLIHPNLKDTEGISLSTKTKDIKGNLPYLEELNAIVVDGEIFYSYYFKEYGSSKISQKLSFAKLYKKLDWVIATGIPLNVLVEKINQHKKIMLKDFEEELFITISIKIIIFILLALAALYFRNKTAGYFFKNLSEANEKLNESNNKLSIATKSGHIGVWKWDLNQNSLEWDEQMYSIYEIEPNSSMNNYTLWSKSIVKEDLENTEKHLENSFKNRVNFNAIFRINTKSGIKYIQAYGHTKCDKRGTPLYMIGVNQDITISKRQEQTIFKQAQSFSEHVIYSRTNAKGIITDVSEAFCKISGYKRSELIGQAHNIVRHPDMLSETFEDLWKKIKKNKTWKGEIKNRKKDGSYYWVLSEISSEYDVNGKFIAYLSVRTDITYKKDLEQQQVQLFEQAKLASLGEMIGNIAHQWRQPLSVITTAASSLKLLSEMNRLKVEELENDLTVINDSAQYLSTTIDTFRNFITEEKRFQEVVLQERIDSSLDILKTTLQNNHIKLINNINTYAPIKVNLVVGELSQVLMNVINNSKDAFLEKKVDYATIIIDLIEKENSVIITIEDNAGGIPEDVLPHVFEPYFTTKHKKQGTGLGLYMSHTIITKSMNGKIYVKNTDIGAKTFIELPLS